MRKIHPGGSITFLNEDTFAYVIPQDHLGDDPEVESESLIAQKFNERGPSEPKTIVGPVPALYLDRPVGNALASFSDGSFIVAWAQRKNRQSPTHGMRILFDPDGNSVGQATPIEHSDRSVGAMTGVDIASLNDRPYVCVRTESSGQGGVSQIKALIKEKNSD